MELSKHDQEIVGQINDLYLEQRYDKSRKFSAAHKAATLLESAENPQGVWDAHLAWGEDLTGRRVDDKYRTLSMD